VKSTMRMTTTSMPVTTPISLLTKTGCVDKRLQLLMRGLLRLHRPHRGRDDDRVCLNLRFQNSRQHETLIPRESRFRSPKLASLDHFLHLENSAPTHAYTESLTDIQKALRDLCTSLLYMPAWDHQRSITTQQQRQWPTYVLCVEEA